MNAARLLSHFERISDAPDAVDRLRRFILDLAVRGKLVEQDPGDEPAEVLLTSLDACRLGEHPKRNSNSSYNGEAPVDGPYRLPVRWVWSRFAQVAEVETNLVSPDDYKDHPHIAPDNIESGTGRLLPYETVRSAAVRSAKHLFQPGRLLYSKIRPALAKVVAIDVTGLCSADMYPLKPLINRGYLLRFMLSQAFIEQSIAEDTRVAMPKINQQALAKILVPLPPLAEQHRIVEKVDELMMLCDRLEASQAERESRRDRLVMASLNRLIQPTDPDEFKKDAGFHRRNLNRLSTKPEHIKDLRKAILNLAGRGKLVPQEESEGTAVELQQGIATAKSKLRLSTGDHRIKHTPPPSTTVPFPIPHGWVGESFENLFLFIDYRGKTPAKTSGGVPLITAKNVRMGFLNREPREFIAPKTYAQWMTRGLPRKGDLFFTTEAPLANVCVNDMDESFGLAQRVVCLQPYGPIDTHWVMYALMSHDMQSLIDAHATGTTARGIKTAKLKPLPIPLPPLAEQKRIVAKVDELMLICDRLENQLESQQEGRRQLLEALLHEALEGVG